jgi:hypothetical protein
VSIVLSLKQFSSRITRQEITKNSPIKGTRTIGKLTQNQSGENQGFLSGLWDNSVAFIGWLVPGTFSNLGSIFTTAWSAIVRTSAFIYNFNWNQSDLTIEAQFNAMKLILAGQLGETVGNALGWISCGIIPSLALISVNEPMGLYVLERVGEEAFEEFSANLSFLLRAAFQALLKRIFFSAYKNSRKAIKNYLSSKSEKEKQAINNFFGGKVTEAIETWGETGTQPWSFRLAIEEKIESIENPFLQEFLEEAHDEFLDACVEAGYVVANSMDDWVLRQELAKRQQQQPAGLYELYPNREAESEKILLYGNSQNLKEQALQTLGHYQLLDNRDVGQWVGEPLRESINKPHLSLAVKILFRGTQQPPWLTTDKKQAKRTQINIPNLKKTKLDWTEIKQAVGGKNGYLWGRYRNVAHFNDGNNLEFYSASESEGEQLLDRLLPLVDAELLTFNSTEETKKGSRQKYKSLYKEITRVYPAFLVIVNHQKILAEESAITKTTGVYKERKYRIPLYLDTKPDDFADIVAEIIKDKGIS